MFYSRYTGLALTFCLRNAKRIRSAYKIRMTNMKVIFNCKYYDFHKDYCKDIYEEVIRRDGEAIISTDEAYFDDADFTIQPDEACKRQGGLGIWINHAFPFVPQNQFYLDESFRSDLQKNSDYIFTFSEEWARDHEKYDLPVRVVGMPKLDALFNSKKDGTVILYAPTFNNDLTSMGRFSLEALLKYGEVIVRGHPAFYKNEISLREALSRATIVISDYSSVGLEAITLNIPAILFESPHWQGRRSNHVSNKAMEAAVCVHDQEGLEKAVETYLSDEEFLLAERSHFSKVLCEHQGSAAKRFVDALEELHEQAVTPVG